MGNSICYYSISPLNLLCAFLCVETVEMRLCAFVRFVLGHETSHESKSESANAEPEWFCGIPLDC